MIWIIPILVAVMIIGYRWVPCRWYGPHDWEILESVWDGQSNSYVKKVCLACGKRYDTYSPYKRKQKLRQFKAERRAEHAKRIWEEYRKAESNADHDRVRRIQNGDDR